MDNNRMSLLTSPFVPEGMVDLMKKLSKGVIKERPANIYEYAAAFFEKMLIERDGSLDKGYGKFRSYKEYCKFMDKMDQRRLDQTTKKGVDIADAKDATDGPQEEVVQPTNIEVQGVAIQGVERKSRDNVKNVSINPKYKSQSEKTAKPVVKNVKAKPRKLSSKKPSENLIVIKEETSADVDDNGNGEFKLNKAAMAIQRAFRLYMSKKSGQGEHFSETSANVSQLSEDAAAVIIQKTFKSLIQKLKSEAQNRNKIAVESNNNIVITGAGQENAINVDKIKNNTDEHSEQILVDDDRSDTKKDLEHNEMLQEKTFDDTANNPEIETRNLDAVTALDAAEMRIEPNESVCDHNEAATASDNIYDTSDNQDLASHQQNKASIPSATSPLDIKTETYKILEVSVGTPLDDLELKDEVAVENDPVDAVGIEAQSSESEVVVSTMENLASNETLVKNHSDDQAEAETIVNIIETELENKSNFTDDKDVGKISSKSKQGDITAPLNSSGTDPSVDHTVTDTNTGTKIEELAVQKFVSRLGQTALEDIKQKETDLSENTSHTSAPGEGLNNVNDNIDKDLSLTDNKLTEEKVVESPVKDQLFVVEKDGIYVNIDLLQDKFGGTIFDDPTGSDTEKTFKLNILEREEILVNQENVQQIRGEALTMSDDAVDKSSDIMAGVSRQKFHEEEESTKASNCDTKDEEGNEEYELAETVVLMDIPSKSYHESEELLPMAMPENATIDTMKSNTLDDEIDKLELSAVDEKGLEKFSDYVKDKIMNKDVAETKPDVDEIIKNEAVVENLEKMDNQLNKMENSQSTFNLGEVSIKEHDICEEKTNPENIDQLSKMELTESNSKEIVKAEVVFGEDETKNENFESQLNESKLTAPDSEKILIVEEVFKDDETKDEKVESRFVELVASDSEKIVKMGKVEEEEFKDEKVEGQLNKNELTSSDSEHIVKVEDVIENEETKNENIQNQLDKNDLMASDSEKIVKVEAVSEGKELKNETVESKNVTELTSDDSEHIVKVEGVIEDEETRNENIESQLDKNDLTATDSEKIVKVEAEFEGKEFKNENVENKNETELTSTDSEHIVEVEGVIKDEETKNENIKDQLDKSDLTATDSEKIAVFEGKELKNENVENKNETELTSTDSEHIVEVEGVIKDEETKNENIKDQLDKIDLTSSDSEKIVKVEAVFEGKEFQNENLKGKNETELKSTDSEHIVEVEGVIKDEETNNENVKDQLDKSDLTTSDSEKIVKVDAVFEGKELKNENVKSESKNETELTSTDSDKIPKLEAVFEDEETKHKNAKSQFNETELTETSDEKTAKVEAAFEVEETTNEAVENQLNKDGSINSIKGNEIDVVNTKSKHVEDQLSQENSGSLQIETNNFWENNEAVVKSENQLDGEDKKCNVELESNIHEKGDEVVQEKTQNEVENVATSPTAEKIDSLMTEDGIVKRHSAAETTDQILESKENEELVRAATIIQKVFRGYIVRNSPTFNSQDKKDPLKLSAALIIQKYARGYLARRKMQKIDKLTADQIVSTEMKNEENDTNGTEDNSNTKVVPQLRAYSNRFLIPKDSFLERESFADDEDYARTCKELAATSIQKSYRGYRVRRSLKDSNETDAATDDVHREVENEVESSGGNDQVQTAVNEAERVISDVLNVAADVLPLETYDLDSFEDEVTDDKNVELESQGISNKSSVDYGSVLGQVVHDNIHVEGQMQQKYNQMAFQGSPINPIEEMSDSSEQPETPREKPVLASTVKSKTRESDSLDSKDYDGSKSFSYEQLSSDLSDTEENKRESQKESEVDETSRDERDDLSEVENFDLSSCGEDSLEAMYYSLRKNEIMVDKMQKQVAEQRVPKNNDTSENFKVEFPERVTENLDVAMQQVFKSMESSSDYDGGKKDEDDNSSTLDLALDDSSSINDEKEIETSRQVKQSEEINVVDNKDSESTINSHAKDADQSPESNIERGVETSNIEQSEQSDSSVNINRDVETSNIEQSQQSDSSVNSSTKFIMKSQSVSEDMMNPIMFAMKRKQALLDQLHVRPYPLQENLSEDHDAFPEHLLTDIDIGNIQRKIFASSVSETDSDYIEPNTTGRRLVRDDFNISTALDHLSSDSDSTIVSAATKIQAGARGFLTRRRLRRSSAGGTSISFEKRYSFGNAAIDKSLEDLIKMQEQINLDGAALKIQQQYRRYQARKNTLKKVSPIREQTTLSGGSSIEGNEGTDDNVGIREITLAQKKVDDYQENVKEKLEDHPISLNKDTVQTVEPVKRTAVNQRRLTLQRGDAVQRNSRPDSQELNSKDGDLASPDNQSTGKFKDSETGEYTRTTDSKPVKKVTAYKNIQSLINRGIGPRQRSMPVQIDSELMRIIPKHLRKRVKSADMARKKGC